MISHFRGIGKLAAKDGRLPNGIGGWNWRMELEDVIVDVIAGAKAPAVR